MGDVCPLCESPMILATPAFVQFTCGSTMDINTKAIVCECDCTECKGDNPACPSCGNPDAGVDLAKEEGRYSFDIVPPDMGDK